MNFHHVTIVVLTIIFITGANALGDENSNEVAALRQEINQLKNLISDIKEKSARETEQLRVEIKTMQDNYESRISEFNKKIAGIKSDMPSTDDSGVTGADSRRIRDNSFNPSIGVVLNGKFSDFSEKNSEILGFGIGEEGERGREGLGIDESEINFSSNIDDKFYGSVTAAIVREGDEDIVELEEAYIQTLPDFGLADGLTLKAGRAFWTLGYLNEHHAHSDDFADRPLPYRAYFNKSFNDDGLELTYVMPFDFYTEVGGGTFRGDDFPSGGGTGSSPESFSGFIRIGADIGHNQSWRMGGYYLGSNVNLRNSNEDMVTFSGDSDLYGTDFRYTWAPTGNANEQEIILQAEYFKRDDDGFYNDTNESTGSVRFDDDTRGWYVQGVYKFLQNWRIGARYSELTRAKTPAGLEDSALDAKGHDPNTTSLMLDWTNSEFSRIRLQYNYEELSKNAEDNQLILQYIISLGAHGAHKF